MKTAILRWSVWLRVCALACAGAALASLNGAETAATGSVQGRVYNPASQEYVRNAEVRLEGTNQVTYTENDGTFQFSSVVPGAATVAITYTGYNSVRDSFTVTAGQIASREINLTSAAGPVS